MRAITAGTRFRETLRAVEKKQFTGGPRLRCR
jgi:hypothetical protein